jgi:hypothetical protein
MAITATISRTAVIPLVVAYIGGKRKEVLHHTQNLLVLFQKVLQPLTVSQLKLR